MTLEEVRAAVVAKALADTSATVELAGPLARRARLATAGLTALQSLAVQAGLDGSQNSNVAYQVGRIRLTMLHRLADPLDEEAYLEGPMGPDQAILTDWRWWKIDPQVYSVEELELTLGEDARIGDVIEYRVDATLRFV